MAVNLEIIRGLVEPSLSTNALIGSGMSPVSSPYDLPVDWRIDFEERAAILEYDGGLTREEADAQALQEINARLEGMKET